MIENYEIYKYSKMEFIQYLLISITINCIIGYLFYSSLMGIILLQPMTIIYMKTRKTELIEKRKRQLNQEFKDGLFSLQGALNAGYSIENAFYQAVADLKLMYQEDALIVREFERIVNQIHMNCTVEETLEELGKRSGDDDIINFADVFMTAKRTGGDIIHVIRTSTSAISEKIEINRDIVTLITAKKLEATIMNIIPCGILLYLRLFSPGFLDPLYHSYFGCIFMSVILVGYYFVSRFSIKIMNIKV